MSATPTRPHIVLHISDQHNPFVMGCAGEFREGGVDTPHLDALAARGCRFTECHCTAPVCGPSRMSMLSGQSPLRNGVLGNRQALASHIPTIAHSLAAAGYDTVLCGRMHFIGPDQRHGFAERLVGDLGPTDPAFREIDLGVFNHSTGQGRDMLAFTGPGRGPSMQFDRDVMDAARARLKAQDPSRPLFLVVGTHAPHNPYVCEPDLFHKYRERLPRPDGKAIADAHATAHPGLRAWLDARDMLDPDLDELHNARAAYYGMVEEVDRQFGRLAAAVDEHLPPDTTYLGYVSDHGDMAGTHGMFWKSCFLDESVKVPMIWRGPDIPAASLARTPVSLLDLVPTFTEWANATAPPAAEGHSLAGLARGEASTFPSDRCLHSVLLDPRTGPSIMLRQGPYKWVRYARHPGDQWADLREGDIWEASPEPPPVDFEALLPEGWDPAALEAVDQHVKQGSTLIRRSLHHQQPPPIERWDVDPSQLSLDRTGPAFPPPSP